MKKLNAKEAKKLLHLNEDEIKYIADIHNTMYQHNKAIQNNFQSSTLDDITFITKIFGYADKFKVFHWAAVSHAMHTQIDDFYAAIEQFKDDIAENIQGITGQFAPDVITKINIPGCTDPIECINNLRDTVLAYLDTDTVKNNPEYEGIRNICSGFIETVYKYIYLLRLCK